VRLAVTLREEGSHNSAAIRGTQHPNCSTRAAAAAAPSTPPQHGPQAEEEGGDHARGGGAPAQGPGGAVQGHKRGRVSVRRVWCALGVWGDVRARCRRRTNCKLSLCTSWAWPSSEGLTPSAFPSYSLDFNAPLPHTPPHPTPPTPPPTPQHNTSPTDKPTGPASSRQPTLWRSLRSAPASRSKSTASRWVGLSRVVVAVALCGLDLRPVSMPQPCTPVVLKSPPQ